MVRRDLLFFCILLAFAGWVKPAAAKRVAFVVGNNDYSAFSKLTNPVNDAKTVAELLRGYGYDVTQVGNVGQVAFVNRYKEFLRKKVDPGDIAVIYFSGHGVSTKGVNYLIPVDMGKLPAQKQERSNLLKLRAINLDSLIADFNALRSKFKVNHDPDKRSDAYGIFILDACRSEISGSKGYRKGEAHRRSYLAPIRDHAGTFVLFAAEANQEALDKLSRDDKIGNSVYTRHLLKLLADKSLGISDIAKKVRLLVYKDAMHNSKDSEGRPQRHTQTPAYYDGFLYRTNILGEILDEKTVDRPPPGKLAALADFPLTKGQTEQSGKHILLECDFCPEMMWIKGEPFDIGSPPEEKERFDAEGPVTRIELDYVFAIGRHEITWKQWNACVADKSAPKDIRCHDIDTGYREKHLKGEEQPHRYGSRLPDTQKPMNKVSWDDAITYVRWLSWKTGKPYRLPSEAEWEFAARARSTAPYSFGKDVGELCSHANGADRKMETWLWPGNKKCNNLFGDDGFGNEPASVGSYMANSFGLFDMHGNVWEWVADCWHDDYAGISKKGKPRGSLKKHCRRVARGGSWQSQPGALRSAMRMNFSQGHRRITLGFRVARDLEVKPHKSATWDQ